MSRVFAVCAAAACVALAPLRAVAQDPPAGAPAAFTLRTSIKASTLVFRAPDAPEIFPDRTGAESVVRVRLEPELRAGAKAVFTLAYEQRLRCSAGTSGLSTVPILPPASAAPFRIRALEWRVADSSDVLWDQEIDRANAQLHLNRADLTIGRQAIGWGRGVIFGAADVFAPFSPLEADREWRRGIDAIRADIKVTDRSSVDLVGAFGTAWDASALAARFRGYAGSLDVEILGGTRTRDLFGGVTSSAALGDAEVHGEAIAFRVPAGTTGFDSTLVWKTLVGGSFRVAAGSGVMLYLEYQYSGFGARNPEEILTLVSRPAFVERYARGDLQVLSRHAVAAAATYEASPELTWSGQWLHGVRDRSGIVAPGVTYTFSNTVSVLGSVYVPYGDTPRGSVLRSEFGSASLSGLLQLRIYL